MKGLINTLLFLIVITVIALTYRIYNVHDERLTMVETSLLKYQEKPTNENIVNVINSIQVYTDSYGSLLISSEEATLYEDLLSQWREENADFKSPLEKELFSKTKKISIQNFEDNMNAYYDLKEFNPENKDYHNKYIKYAELNERFKYTSDEYRECNRSYSQTSRNVTSSHTEEGVLTYDVSTGEVSLKPSEVKEQTNTITSSMDEGVFNEFCSPGARSNPRTPACPYYMECVTDVYHKKNLILDPVNVFSFERVASILRDDKLKQGRLKSSISVQRGVASDRPNLKLFDVKNFTNACDVVSRTNNSNVVAAEIYANVPEIKNYTIAKKLGEKAIRGYGECNCVLQNYTGIKQVMSIGYCDGDKYFDY